MSIQPAAINSYDEIPFPSQPLPQSHPDRMACAAKLFGMQPQPIDRCRVLELGCATGGNLIPMADRHPDSVFVGIDYSARQIAAGREAIRSLGLKNIELRHLSIADVDEGLGSFDYILCHGVFSWVDHALQEKILSICNTRLNPQGVAYLSYNTYPGWHLRGILRKLLRECTPETTPAQVRIAHGRRLLQFFSAALSSNPAPYGQLLKGEIDLMLRQDDGYLYHEFLETENHPLYFFQFAERAAAHDLRYLADATPANMFAANFGAGVEAQLIQMAPDEIALEQHMDVLRHRAFRQTLLCHADAALTRNLTAPSVDALYFIGQIRPQNETADLNSLATERFVAADGTVISSSTPRIKAALVHLGAIWPRSASLGELVDAARQRLSADGDAALDAQDREALANNLIQCLANGIVEMQSEPDGFVTTISEYPRASQLARAQVRAAAAPTNRRHAPVRLDEVATKVLAHLDGEHDRTSLRDLLAAAVDRGELSILIGGVPASRGAALDSILDETVEQSLAKLAGSALLVA